MKKKNVEVVQYARGEMDERLASDPGYRAFVEEMEAKAKERELADFREAKSRRGYGRA